MGSLSSLLLSALVLQAALSFRPDEQPGLFEGDIVMPRFRSALHDRTRLWDGGVIPYEFHEKAIFTDEQRANITAAMEEFHKHTCIRWKPRDGENAFIRFENGNGCASNVGKLKTTFKITQRIKLGMGCFDKGVIMHEMLHTVGFFHEQSRWDRDTYVKILPQNIKQGFLDQFRVHRLEDQYRGLGPYDYGSLMHYRKDTFSAEGKDTIVPLKDGAVIGQRERFSEIDIYKINRLYKCPGSEKNTLPPAAYTTPSPYEEGNQTPNDLRTRFGCTFDQKWACDFHDDISSDLDWKIGKGKSSRGGLTGPSFDAKGKECCYMHIKTMGHDAGESSRLIGPLLKPNTPSCLNFWYHMKGESIGTLRVYIQSSTGEKGEVVFEKTGEQSDAWLEGRAKVEHDEPFRLVFEATVGDSETTTYEGNIAIDSVRYQDTDSIQYYDGEC